ncbi:MAG: class I SAM-dependent methyltransferase [Synergistaceae bacterium]|nr:class I SAM-dependent methyltransferase [Synergistaceae bacterium]
MGLLNKFFDNAGKPEGFMGRVMITGMNIFHARVARWGMSHLKIDEPSEIAELGCGGGKNIRDLLMKYPSSKVTGLDYSPLSLEKARGFNKEMISAGRCEIIEGDVSAMPFEDGRFGLATAFETIYFWPGLVKCFSEVRRILKDGGHFMIVSESDGKDKPSLWFKSVISAMNTYTPEEIWSALKSAGFREIKTEHHESHSWVVIISRK